jgi:hypothetical protein
VIDQNEQQRKLEVLKFTNSLTAAGISRLSISYSGSGDEGTAEAPQLEDVAGNPVEESTLPPKIELQKIADLLEGFVPEGYENGEGGHGTITFNVPAQKIFIEHNWYETISTPDEPREL